MSTRLLLLVGWVVLLLQAAAAFGNLLGSQSLPPITLRILSTPGTCTFASRASIAYQLQRAGEVSVDVSPVELLDNSSPSAAAFSRLRVGRSDGAFAPYVPTAADMYTQPDIATFPFWAVAYGAVYNVAEAGAGLILSPFALARIMAANVTRWDDPLIQRLNPTVKLPSRPIHVVLQMEPGQYIYDLVSTLAAADPTGFTINPSITPKWPTARYANFSAPRGTGLPTSVVMTTPYSIAVELVAIAKRLNAPVASMRNAAGVIVRPSVETVQEALMERAMKGFRSNSSSSSNVTLQTTWSASLSGAPGKRSWPFTLAVSLMLPRLYARQGCRARSELAKFLLWMLRSDSIRFSLAASEGVALISSEIDAQAGVSTMLTSTLQCGTAVVNNGIIRPITTAGGALEALQTDQRAIFMQLYATTDTRSLYSFAKMDELQAVQQAQISGVSPDLAWIFPQTFPLLYPGYLESALADKRISLVHSALYGVAIGFNLPETALALHTPYLPLVLSVDLLASLFVGDIASWSDPRMLAFNPYLADSFVGSDTNITLVFYGRGDRTRNHLSSISNHFFLALNRTQQFQRDPILGSLPVDCSRLAARLDARGIRYAWVDSEQDMESTIARIPGAIGYYLGRQESSDQTIQFRMAMPIAFDPAQPNNMTMVLVAPTPDAFLACAGASQVTQDDSFLQEALTGVDPLYAKCWPFPILLSIVLASDLTPTDNGLEATDAEWNMQCSRQVRVADFGSWLSTHSTVAIVAKQYGSALISQLPQWRAHILRSLDGIMCLGRPVLYTPAVTWTLNNGVKQFGLAAAIVGATLTALVALALMHYRRRTMIKVAHVKLQLVSLLGLLLIFITPLLFVAAPSAASCSAFGWLLALGITCTYVPMSCKIYAVHRLHVQRRAIKISPFKHIYMFVALAAALLIDIVLLSIAQSHGGLMQPVSVTLLQNSRDHIYEQCGVSSEVASYAYVLGGLKGLLLLWTALTAAGVRRVASSFGESTQLSWAVWTALLSGSIITPLVLLTVGIQSDVGVFLIAFLLFWCGLTTLFYAFGSKMLTLLRDEMAAVAAQASNMSSHMSNSKGSKLGASSTGRSKDKSGGTTSASATSASAYNLPSLEGTSLSILEKYISALEVHLQHARSLRRKQFGEPTSIQFNSMRISQTPAAPAASAPSRQVVEQPPQARPSVPAQSHLLQPPARSPSPMAPPVGAPSTTRAPVRIRATSAALPPTSREMMPQ